MSPEIVIRRAKPSDLDSILEIRGAIYGGNDHVKAHYNVWLQDPRCYLYVAEIDRNIVASNIMRIMEDGRTAYWFAASTAPEFAGLGIQQTMKAVFFKEIKQVFPSVDTFHGAAFVAPGFRSAMQKDPSMRIVEDWVYHVHMAENDEIQSILKKITSNAAPSETSEQSEQITYTLAMRALPDILDFLEHSGVSYIMTKIFPTNYPRKLTAQSLRECIMANDWILTRNAETNRIHAVSYHHAYQNNYSGTLTYLRFYGKKMSHFKQHIQIFVKHTLSMVDRGNPEKTVFQIHFPRQLGENVVEQYLTTLLGRRVETYHGMTSMALFTSSNLL